MPARPHERRCFSGASRLVAVLVLGLASGSGESGAREPGALDPAVVEFLLEWTHGDGEFVDPAMFADDLDPSRPGGAVGAGQGRERGRDGR